MSRRRSKRKRDVGSSAAEQRGRLTIDRKRKAGHYQGKMYSEVYRDGHVFVYTAWNDNEEEVGRPMDFEEWVRSVRGR